MQGTDFCGSASATFYMMIRNPAAWAALTYISYIMFLLGKGLIIASSAYITYIVTQYALGDKVQ
jgi:hypothetical protein